MPVATRLPSHGGVQGLRRYVRPVRPGDRTAVEVEPPEVIEVPERLEDRALEPAAEAEGGLDAVVENDPNAMAATVLSLNYRREKRHDRTLLQRLNPLKRMTSFQPLPIGL